MRLFVFVFVANVVIKMINQNFFHDFFDIYENYGIFSVQFFVRPLKLNYMKTNVCTVVMFILIFLLLIALLCCDNNWSVEQFKNHATDVFIIIASIIIVLFVVFLACCHCQNGTMEMFFSNLKKNSSSSEKREVLKAYVESQGKNEFIKYAIEHDKLDDFVSLNNVSSDGQSEMEKRIKTLEEKIESLNKRITSLEKNNEYPHFF